MGGNGNKKSTGFKMGMRWGWSGFVLAFKAPLFYLAGLVMLAVAIALSIAWRPAAIPAMLACVSGIACAGAAARALSARLPGQRAPWGAWIEPWRRASRIRHLARLAVSVVFFLAMAIASQWFTRSMYAQSNPVEAFSSWEARGAWLALCYALLVWLMASAGPARGLKGSLSALGRIVAAPFALAGFALFWFVVLALSDALLSYAVVSLVQADAGGQGSGIMGMSALIIFVTLAASAPALAMSAGLAGAYFDERPEETTNAIEEAKE
jgi:hypothetical protein